MTTRPIESPPESDLVLRQPTAEEMPRVAHLFRGARLRPDSHLVLAERVRPFARLVAAAAWVVEGKVGRVLFACQPGVSPTELLPPLAEAVAAAARAAGVSSLQCADLLPDGHPWLEVLAAQGFVRIRSERCFESPCRDTWIRIHRLFDRHRAAIPPGWRTAPIREHRPETILELIAPHRLLVPEEVRRCWQATEAAGFDAELSCILFERERPFGALLARRASDIFFVDVQVIQEPNPRLRSLADLCLLYHVASRVRPEGPIHRVRFRCGETEHLQTANLALRMGGRELGRLHVYGRELA